MYDYYLFTRPSFLEGMARTFDLFGVWDDYNLEPDPIEANRLATASDWQAVGCDLQNAIDQYVQAHPELLKS